METQFVINEKAKKIIYSEKSSDLIKEYIINNPNFTVFFEMSDLVSKKALKLFDFLQEHKNGFVVVRNITSFDTLSQYQTIKTLVTEHKVNSIKNPKIDLLNFSNLTYLSTEWNSKITNLGSLTKLKELNLFKYKPKSKNLIELSTLDSLENLKLGSGNFENLNGLDRLKKLRTLRLYSNRFIKTDDNLTLESIEELYIASCKSFDHNFYKSFPNLKTLDIDSSIPIETLKPILDSLRRLENLNVYACNILEEDICYWKDYKNIKSLNFRNRKHFNLKTHDFENYPYDKNGNKKSYTKE